MEVTGGHQKSRKIVENRRRRGTKSIKIAKLRAREPRRGPRDPRNRPREAKRAKKNAKKAKKGEKRRGASNCGRVGGMRAASGGLAQADY